MAIPSDVSIGRLVALFNGVYARSGMAAESSIAVGEGCYYPPDMPLDVPIGKTAAGVRHDTLFVRATA